MADWSASMNQTFEYYIVDPGTWRDVSKLDNVKSCSITRDSTVETLGSATIDITDSVGECYIRVYLIVDQNGVREKIPLGTYLVQTPSSSFDGKIRSVTMDAYTPLLELKESRPPIGYFLSKDDDSITILDYAYRLVNENVRAPVIRAERDRSLEGNNLTTDFVANTSDTWLTYVSDLIATVKYSFSLDEMGRILFAPNQDTASLQPVWTYTDDNSSILYPEISVNHDIYGIPNVVEVVYSVGSAYVYSKAVNDDPNSPISTVNRGREIIHRVTDPGFVVDPKDEELAQVMIDEYAKQALRELSTLEYTISYTHGYCPVRVGDCVRLNYSRAGLTDIKAKVVSQSIKCEAGCSVSEKAVFTNKLWG